MKIIHTGDIHLGSSMKHMPPDKAKLRKTELLDTFRQLVSYAKQNDITAVVIAGDLFDDNRVSRQLKREVFQIISSAQPVGFFYVSGNHDDEFDYEDVLPQNFFLFSKNHGWQSYNFAENVTLTGLDAKYMDEKKWNGLALQEDRFHIVALHGDVTGNERNATYIPLRQLQNKHIDYLALGHIHKPTLAAKRLDGRGIYRYCGCLEGRGFDECGQRGFFLLEIQNGRLISERFISLSKRVVVEARVDISACEGYYDVERVTAETLQQVPQGSIVKIVLCGRHQAGLRKDITLLQARCEEKFFFVRVEDQSQTAVDYHAYENDFSVRGEFVREVGRCALSDEMRAEILDVGLKALAGEEIDL